MRGARRGRRPRPAGARATLVGLAFWALAAAPAGAQVRGTIVGPGGSRIPLAIVVRPEGGPAARTFVRVLGTDLDYSGRFRAIATPPNGARPGRPFARWAEAGVLLVAEIYAAAAPARVEIEARLFDVAERRQTVGRSYRGAPAQVARMAHRFADAILEAVTGERGPFDSRIAFLASRGGRLKGVYTTTFDGRTERLTPEDTLYASPVWLDPSRLIVTAYRAGAPRLLSIDLDRRRWRVLPPPRPGLVLPGGRRPGGAGLAATAEYDGNPEIVLLDAAGRIRERLTNHWAIDVSPSFAPDGTRLAFCSTRSGSPQIYVLDLASRAVRRLTYRGSYNTSPAWSPRGDRIAYVGRVAGRFHLFTIGPEGGEPRRLTWSAGDNEDPSWSPDGRYLVFSSTRAGRAKLYVTDAWGSFTRQLTRGEGDDTSPAWSSWLPSRPKPAGERGDDG